MSVTTRHRGSLVRSRGLSGLASDHLQLDRGPRPSLDPAAMEEKEEPFRPGTVSRVHTAEQFAQVAFFTTVATSLLLLLLPW